MLTIIRRMGITAAAQVVSAEEEGANDVVVATTNPRHLSRFVSAGNWREIPPSASGRVLQS